MKKIILSIIGVMVISLVIFASKGVQANRSYIVPPTQTASATTSVEYIGGANNPSTLTLDSYTYSPTPLGSTVLLIQSTASSTVAVQTLEFTHSNDGIDWFSDYMATSTVNATNGTVVRGGNNTIVIRGNTTASTTRAIVSVRVPVRYLRATVTGSTASSSVWMQFVSQREMTN